MELKILIIINGWTGKAVSGGDYHILRVMKEWINSHELSLIIPLIALEPCRFLLQKKYDIYLSSSSNQEIVSFDAITSYFKRIIKTIFMRLKDRPNVIVSSSHLFYDTLPAFILSLRYRTKLVVYVHHIIGEHRDQGGNLLSRLSVLSEKLSFPFIKRANSIFVVNQEVKENLIKMGFEPGKIVLSANGIDYDSIEAARTTGEFVYDACFCGRLVKTKGIYDLLDVWKLVVHSYPDSKLVILGDGPEFTNLSNKIRESNIEGNIQLKGFVSEHDKFVIMKQSRLFIFPSYEEGWAIAVAEAVACGLPVISYDLRAYKPLGSFMIKVELGNKSKMSKVIIDELEKRVNNRVVDREIIKIVYLKEWKDIASHELEVIFNMVHAKD